MFVKMKCYRLKKDVDVKTLEEYDFKKNSFGNYTRTINGEDYIIYYADTKRFVLRIFIAREGRARKVGKYIKDLINHDLVEKVTFWEWWTFIGRWQNYPDEKIQRIEDKLDKLNKQYEND